MKILTQARFALLSLLLLGGFSLLLTSSPTHAEGQLNSSEYKSRINADPDGCGVSLEIPDFLPVNDDDDQNPGDDGYEKWDWKHSPSPEDDDLDTVVITGTAGDQDATMTLSIEKGGDKIGGKFWKDSKKNSEQSALSWNVPANSSLTVKLYIEGQIHSGSKNDVILKAVIVCGESRDEVTKKTTVYQVDMDVDSFNDAGSYNDEEDQIEFSEKEGRTGMFIYTTQGDANNNGIPDEADFEGAEEGGNSRFALIQLSLKEPFTTDGAKVTFDYEMSHPVDDLASSGKAVEKAGLRIWTKDWNDERIPESARTGDFVPAGTELSWKDLSGGSEVTLYVEYVQPECAGGSSHREPIEITVTEGEASTKDAVNGYIKKAPPGADKGGENWSEISGWRFRRLALNGMPLSASKGQAKAESDEETEETYIDSLNMLLRHDTTDVYIPSLGGQMALTVKRSISPEIWGDGTSAKLSERNPYAFPFGLGWSSSIAPHIRLENVQISCSSGSGHLYPGSYVYVTDENGASYRFAQVFINNDEDQKYFLPLPSNRTDKDVFASQLKFESGEYVFIRKFGTQLKFEGSAAHTDIDVISVWSETLHPLRVKG